MVTINAENVIAQIGSLDPLLVAINFLVCAFGIFLHYAKKVKLEQVCWKEYWTEHKNNSIASIGGVLFSFIALQVADPKAALSAFFAIGYVGDSILNKVKRV